jgi:hypothetical protein
MNEALKDIREIQSTDPIIRKEAISKEIGFIRKNGANETRTIGEKN